MRTRIALFALLALLLGAASAGAQAPFRGHERPRGDAGLLLPLMLRSAQLTPEQEARVREIISAHRAASRALVEQLHQAHADLADRLFAPGALQEADLAPALQQIDQLRAKLLRESARVALEVRALLTPEQLQKAARVKDRLRTLESEMRRLLEPAKR